MNLSPKISYPKLLNKNLLRDANVNTFSTSGFAKTFNLRENDCEWPTVINGTNVEPCNFQFMETDYTINYKNNNIKIVTIPSGTVLYHGTREKNVILSSAESFNSVKNIIWFASTVKHALLTNPFDIYEYAVGEPLHLVFIKNIDREMNISSGNNFVIDIAIIAHRIYEKYGINIDGYAGCNECEYGILIPSIQKLEFPPHKMAVSSKIIS